MMINKALVFTPDSAATLQAQEGRILNKMLEQIPALGLTKDIAHW